MKPYRPSNGSEGACFIAQWCSNCKRDRAMNGTAANPADPGDDDYCEILSRSFREDEPLPEWIADDSGPRCTAFEPMDAPERDTHTLDMFGGAA